MAIDKENEEIPKETLKFFDDDLLRAKVFHQKYALRDKRDNVLEKTPEDMWKRIATAIATVEPDPENWRKKFYWLLKDFKFVPGGRINYSVGNNYVKSSPINCYIIPIKEDSIDGIFDAMKEQAKTYSYGGGCGIDISPLRPRGSRVSNSARFSTGAASFMDIFSMVTGTIGQYNRRGALLLTIDIQHPDVLEFIDVKNDDTRQNVRFANISIKVRDEFMKSVEEDRDWIMWYPEVTDIKYSDDAIRVDTIYDCFEYPDETFFNVKGEKHIRVKKIYKKVRAKDVWDKIIENAWQSGEPGIVFFDTIKKYSNSEYFHPVITLNPCVTGDTLIATADGRDAVPIKKLAEENKDIPVYCLNDDGNLAIRMMRNPRITGYNTDIYKVTLDDGSEIKCNSEHKFILKDGNVKKAIDLKQGDSVSVKSKWKTTWDEIMTDCNSKSNEYWMLHNGEKLQFEHSFVYEQLNDTKIMPGNVIHHKDFNSLNNNLNNLKLMTKEAHDSYHCISGDKNPMIKWYGNASQEEKNEYHRSMSKATSGKKNENYIDVSNDEIFNAMIDNIKRNNIPLTSTSWKSFAKKHNYPQRFTEYRGSLTDMIYRANHECGFNTKKHGNIYNRQYIKYLNIMKDTDLDVRFSDNKITVHRKCEGCGKELVHSWAGREITYCRRCSLLKILPKSIKKNKRDTKNRRQQKLETAIDLFIEYVNENRIIPSMDDLISLFNTKKINDFRSLGMKSYKEFLSKIFDIYNVEINSRRICNDEYSNSKAIALIDNGAIHNHKVVSVVKIGKETVYNGTVDEFHNFGIALDKKETNSGRDKLEFIFTPQCGEITLPSYGACCLGHINLSKIVENEYTDDYVIDWDELEQLVDYGVRFLDNVISYSIGKHPIDAQSKTSERERRIGLGITGLADFLARCQTKYDTKDAINLVDEVMEFIRNKAYLTSVQLAIEKGTFPGYTRTKYMRNGFIATLPEEIQEQIKQYGTRNVALLTVAPVGTGSILAGTTSGIEPLFAKKFMRRTESMGSDEYEIYDYSLRDYIDEYGIEDEDNFPSYFVVAHDIDPEYRIKMQSIIQQYVDNSISSTVNLHKMVHKKTVDKLYFDAWKRQCKGITVFREGSREGILKTINSDGETDCDSEECRIDWSVDHGEDED